MSRTEQDIERESILIANGLMHKGACACGVGSHGVLARLYRCSKCDTKSCFQCKRVHRCPEPTHA